MPRALVLLGLALTACSAGPVRRLAPPRGLADSDTAAAGDSADSAADSASDSAVDSADDSGDSSEPGVPESCWLGADRSWSTCVDTIPWSASWGSDYTYPEPYDGSPQYAVPERYVVIDDIDPDLAIAPNFVVSEYLSSAKGPYGILQDHMTAHLQDVRDAIGGPLTVNSGYRNPAYNASVGGVEYSRHQYGDAADLQASGWSVEDLGTVCEDLGAGYVGLYEDGHTHCDWRDEPLDPAYFPTARGRAYAPRPVVGARLVADASGWTAPAAGFDEGEPLRRWTAYGADGRVIDSATGRAYAPPAEAVRLTVRVGGRVTVEARLR